MEARSVFKRSFWLFENEDSGYEQGQKPKGYIKTEERDGKGKLWLSVQNLKKTAGRYSYELKLLRAIGARFSAADMGRLEEGNNGYSLEVSFDAANVNRTGIRLQDFDTAVVLVRFDDKEIERVICPLVAYKSVKTEWRSRISEGFKPSGRAAASAAEIKAAVNKAIPADPLDYKKIESKYVPEESKPSLNINEKSREMFTENPGMQGSELLMGVDAGQAVELDRIIKEGVQDDACNGDAEISRAEANESRKINEADMPQSYEQSGQNGLSSAENEVDCNRPKRPLDDGIKPQTPENTAFENVNTSCVYMNGSMCGGYMKDGVSNPCSGCRAYSNPPVQEKKDSGLGNIDKLKELLEANFEKCDPFNSNRSDYKWWKVANPVNLNNLLYECNIRSPLLFNPNVMMSHYKYRHLIIGVFTDRQTKKEYLVCGVPGMHMVDKRPFDDLCRWVQFEGSKPLYGAFGYWLVYIDPKTGRLISTR